MYYSSYIRQITVFLLLLTLQGCTDTRYYLQSVSGQLEILQKRQDINSLLVDQGLDPVLRERLELVQKMRKFAVKDLKLPDTSSYTGYTDLKRNYVVKNLVAAPEFDTQLHSWCYPVIGCATYRGYFDQNMLTRREQDMKARGFDTYIASVPAYSTLGWFDDPVLNTVLHWPDHLLAGLIFHELAHQRIYVDGDTMFNESFATAVEQIGTTLWIMNTNSAVTVAQYNESIERKNEVLQLIQKTHKNLELLYQTNSTHLKMREIKKIIFDDLKKHYTTLRETWDSDPGFDDWVSTDMNNAKLGSMLNYHSHVDAFIQLFRNNSSDLERFYHQVEVLSSLPQTKRNQRLDRHR